ncbi:MAG: LytTR family DNA-binding domain-containing protein [Bacteroidales bacterium]|nr:LytTR family DNA-binding domain-containing protein [Bacteroidales bacterium]
MKSFKHIKTVIVDDEKISRDAVFNLLKTHYPDFSIEVAEDVKSGIETISGIKPQFIFLDVDMPDGTGFDLLNKLTSYNFKVIFITAHQEHALKAIKFSALDYILKPINTNEFISAVNKAINETENEKNKIKIDTFLNNFKETNSKSIKLVLNTAESIHVVGLEDIIRCESDNNYTCFFLNNSKKLLMSKTLKEYENLLPETIFIRVHRSHLINIFHIERFDKRKSGKVIMKDKSVVPVSVRKKELLLKVLSKLS